jgi:hypothetical protein
MPTSNGGVLFGGMASEPATGAVYVVTHDNPASCACCARARRRTRRAAAPPGQAIYQQNCQSCHGPDRLGTANGVALTGFDGGAIRAVLAAGKGRMPSFPHLAAADVDAVVAFVTSAPARPWARRGSRWVRRAADLIVGAGSVAARPAWPPDVAAARCRRIPTASAVRAAGDQRIQHRGAPHRPAVHVDREVRLEPARHQWRVGFGDDPALAARGITGTGMPALNHGVVVTESGLVFGAGGDNYIRAWDSDTGRRSGRRASPATSPARPSCTRPAGGSICSCRQRPRAADVERRRLLRSWTARLGSVRAAGKVAHDGGGVARRHRFARSRRPSVPRTSTASAPAAQRAAFLDRIAEQIEQAGELLQVAHAETALPPERLAGERARTPASCDCSRAWCAKARGWTPASIAHCPIASRCPSLTSAGC